MILEQTPRRLVVQLYRQVEHLRKLEAISARYPALAGMPPTGAEQRARTDIANTRQKLLACRAAV